eukprot:6392821-Heterocapsa_arctica.AAC.1
MAPFSEGGARGSDDQEGHVGDEMEDGSADEGRHAVDEGEEEEGRAPVLRRSPFTPAKQDIEEHMATHIPL